MTSNIPASVFWTLVLAFFVVVGIGVALAWYSARSLKRNEQAAAAASEPAAPAVQSAEDTSVIL